MCCINEHLLGVCSLYSGILNLRDPTLYALAYATIRLSFYRIAFLQITYVLEK
ncbi:unnamed protein product [Chironomus riparius]|uniref:Uncharacterized protein n=1 Tax=Chironomus riparius TaxID=315576 RepID=A0A9N9S0F0_9DIPT|nr:unnamed protein product [Chironomus riparius]